MVVGVAAEEAEAVALADVAAVRRTARKKSPALPAFSKSFPKEVASRPATWSSSSMGPLTKTRRRLN